MSVVSILEKNTPLKKQFILKCNWRDRPFIISGFLEDQKIYDEDCHYQVDWVISSSNHESRWITVNIESYDDNYVQWWFECMTDSFDVDEVIIFPSKQEIQSILTQNSYLRRYIVRKIIEKYL